MIPFRGTLNIRCRIIVGIQEGTIIVTTTHISDVLPSPLALSDSLTKLQSVLPETEVATLLTQQFQ